MRVPSKSTADLRDEYQQEFPDTKSYDDTVSDISSNAGSGSTGASPDPGGTPEVPPAVYPAPSSIYDKCILVSNFFREINLKAQEMAYYISAAQSKMNKFVSTVGNFSLAVPSFPKASFSAWDDVASACPFLVPFMGENPINKVNNFLSGLQASMQSDVNGFFDQLRDDHGFDKLVKAAGKINMAIAPIKALIYQFISIMNAIVRCLEALCKLTSWSTYTDQANAWKKWAVGSTDGGFKESFLGQWASDAQNQNAAKLSAFNDFAKPIPKWTPPDSSTYSGT